MKKQIKTKAKNSTKFNQSLAKKIISFEILFFLIILLGIFYLLKTGNKSNSSVAPVITPAGTENLLNSDYNYTLLFKEGDVTLDRMGSGNVEGTFWDLPVKNIDKEITPDYSFATLESGYLYYFPQKNTFYELQPGGYSIISLISSVELSSRLKNETGQFKKISCKMNDFQLGIPVKAIKCTTTITNPDDPNQIDESFTNNCYLPLENNKYLAYEQILKPLGDMDLCESLTKMGVQGATFESKNTQKAINMLQELPEIGQIQKKVTSVGHKTFFMPEENTGDIIRIFLIESFPDDPHTTRIDTFDVNVKTNEITIEDVATGKEISLEEWKKTVKERFP